MSTTYTTNYHLGKQEDTSDNFNMSVITDNMDTIDSVLGNKSDKSSTYTKTEVDTALGSKQNTISDLATIRSGAALGATAVQPETGKGLSTNDYTTAEKNKLAGIEVQANKTTVDDALNDSSTNPVQNKVVKAALDNKADTADIPTVPITAIQKNGTGITPVSGTVNITVPTTAADVSALPDTTKYAAALSLTINSSTFVMTGQLKDQNGDNLGTAQTIDLPLESVVVGGSYNSQTKKVVLTLQNGNTIEFSVADLISGLQTELSASNKLNPAYINYDSTHRAVSDTEKSTWNDKQNALSSAQLAAVNSGINSEKVAQYDSTTELEAEDRAALVEIVDGGAKNLFNPSNYNVVSSIVGVTVTPNGDGTYTLSGAASGSTADFLYTTSSVYTNMYGLKAGGTYTIVSGDDKVLIRVDASTNPSSQWNRNLVTNVANKATFTIPDNIVGLWIRIRVPIASGNVDNVIVTPMICTKAAWDISHEYQPYRPSYQELYEMVKALQAAT